MTLYVRLDIETDEAISAVAVHPLKWAAVLRGDVEQPTWGFRQATAKEIDDEATTLRRTALGLYQSVVALAYNGAGDVNDAAKVIAQATDLIKLHGIEIPVPAPTPTPEE